MLVLYPPAVLRVILPVFAPAGTVVVIRVGESIANEVALMFPKSTSVDPLKPVPDMTTWEPTWPLGGVKLRISGKTRNDFRLFKTAVPAVTDTSPVIAALGTIIVGEVAVRDLIVAAPPPNDTCVAAVKPWPRRITGAPTSPPPGITFTKGVNPEPFTE